MLPCRLRGPATSVADSPVLLACAEGAAEWYFREKFDGRGCTYSQLLEVLEEEWKRTPFFAARATISPLLYHQRSTTLGRVCSRLRDLFCIYEIVQPVEPYSLEIDGITISGSYAVVRSDRRKRHGIVVYLRDGGPRARPLVPDAASFARYLDLQRRDAGWDSIGVLHWWVSSYIATEHQPDRTFAENVMRGVAANVLAPGFPNPGTHCRACSTRGCRLDIARLEPEEKAAGLFAIQNGGPDQLAPAVCFNEPSQR